jgi:hypothetical protein
MRDYIKEQAEIGEHMYYMITPEKKIRLASIAAKIVNLQVEVNKSIKALGIDEYCAKCKDDCCKDTYKDEIFSREYFLFLLLVVDDEVKTRIWETLDLINLTVDECIFKHPFTGCEIPDGVRPPVCKSFFCGKTDEMRRTEDAFRPEFEKLELEFRRELYRQ